MCFTESVTCLSVHLFTLPVIATKWRLYTYYDRARKRRKILILNSSYYTQLRKDITFMLL